MSSHTSRSFLLMNAGTFNDQPPDNIVPPWLLQCTCIPRRYHCPARFKPDILCIRGLPYNSAPPTQPHPSLTIQFIEFTFCNDRFSPDTIALKCTKYQPLLDTLQSHGWIVAPLMGITTSARATTHIPSIQQLHQPFKSQNTPSSIRSLMLIL
jgi:hypothetical protein